MAIVRGIGRTGDRRIERPGGRGEALEAPGPGVLGPSVALPKEPGQTAVEEGRSDCVGGRAVIIAAFLIFLY